MNVVVALLLVLNIVFSIICICHLHKLYNLLTTVDVVSEENVDTHAAEREETFNNRINTMKEELALSTSPQNIKGCTAEILHPSIQNLPHDNVKTRYDLYPQLEVAE